jgi:hypothetical protein
MFKLYFSYVTIIFKLLDIIFKYVEFVTLQENLHLQTKLKITY